MKRKTKSIAIASLLAALGLSCVGAATVGVVENIMSSNVQAQEVQNVAKIGDQSYTSLADALTAAKTMTGDVTVMVEGKMTLNTSFTGSYDSISFVGASDDAEICLQITGYITGGNKNAAVLLG